MSLATDIMVIDRIGLHFKRFSKTTSGGYRLRCPYCGDSSKSQHSTSAVFVRSTDGDSMYFFCHRGCGSKSIGQFLKDHVPNEYPAYIKESLSDPYDSRYTNNAFFTEKKTDSINISEFCDVATPLSKINHDSPLWFAKELAIKRRLPESSFGSIYATTHLYRAMKIIPKYQTDTLMPDAYEPALMFPFYTDLSQTVCDGVIFRKLRHDATPKYLMMSLNDDSPVYGAKFINKSLPVIATEGVFDKYMVNNSIMMSGVNKWQNLPTILGLKPSQFVLVFDNDFVYNQLIRKQMLLAADAGFNIFIHPELDTTRIKDLNEEAMLRNMSVKEITDMVLKNTFNGLRATFEIGRH